ncbi:hypothetical protein D3C78_1637260 [compost metagenome]
MARSAVGLWLAIVPCTACSTCCAWALIKAGFIILVLRYGQDTGLFAAYMKRLQRALFAPRDTLSSAILRIVT